MRFSKTLALASFAAIAAADDPYTPLAHVIYEVVDQADKDTVALNAAVSGFNGNIQPVIDAANKLIQDVTAGKPRVDGTAGEPLGLDDTAWVSGPSTTLLDDSKTLVANFQARKADVEKGNYCGLVQKQTKTIAEVSTALIDTVTTRIGPDGQALAEALAKMLKASLQSAVDAYADCKDANPTSTTTTTTSTTSSTGTTTSSTGTTTSSTGTTTSSTGTTTSSTGTTTSSTGTGTTTTTTTTTTTGGSGNSTTTTSTTGGSGGVTTITTSCTTPASTPTGGSGCNTCPGGGNNPGNGNGGNGNGNGGSGNGNGGSGNGNGGSGNGNGGSPPVVVNGGNVMAPAGALALAIAALVM